MKVDYRLIFYEEVAAFAKGGMVDWVQAEGGENGWP